jgi:hypothetical protein
MGNTGATPKRLAQNFRRENSDGRKVLGETICQRA